MSNIVTKTNQTNQMKTVNQKNKKQVQLNAAKLIRTKRVNEVIPFYITVVSITAIFALLTIFILEKNETLKCVKNGLVQKVDNGKVFWTKP
jgi:hypothetical protein